MSPQSTDAANRTITISDYRAETFEGIVGERMILIPTVAGPPPATMKLVEVCRGTASPYFERQQFSLLFLMKDQLPLAGCLYAIDWPGFAPEGILLSRVIAPKYRRMDPDAIIYEAVFT